MPTRARADGAWASGGVIKGKTNIIPVETGKFGLALEGGFGFDLLTGETASIFFFVPVTYQFSDVFRVNLNAGWLWDRTTDRHSFTWGAGAEWIVLSALPRVTLIGEVFGLAGSGSNEPRFQAGVRLTPQEWFDIDIIYGRNLTGENANWFTIGLNVRFDVWAAK